MGIYAANEISKPPELQKHLIDWRSDAQKAQDKKRGLESETDIAHALLFCLDREPLLKPVVAVIVPDPFDPLDMAGVDEQVIITPHASRLIGTGEVINIQCKSSAQGERMAVQDESRIRRKAKKHLGRRYLRRQIMTLCGGDRSQFAICSDFLLGTIRLAGLSLNPACKKMQELLYEFGHPMLAERTLARIDAMWNDPNGTYRLDPTAGAAVHGSIVTLPIDRVWQIPRPVNPTYPHYN